MFFNTVAVIVFLISTGSIVRSSIFQRRFRQSFDYKYEGIYDKIAEADAIGNTTVEPKKLPRLSRTQKFALIRQRLADDPTPGAIAELESKERVLKSKDQRKKNRRETFAQRPRRPAHVDRWQHVVSTRPMAIPPGQCPQRFDAVTQANMRTYIFAGDVVYEIYRRDGLQQKSAFRVGDMFPAAPRPVIAALTNRRSGVTILVGAYNTHRYVWNRRVKQFQQTRRRSIQRLPRAIDFRPTVAFQWRDGNLILANANNEKFVCFDAYWNTVLHSGLLRDYMPKLPRDAIGVAYAERNDVGGKSHAALSTYTLTLLTTNRQLQLYDTRKWTVAQTYPLAVGEFLACFTPKNIQPK